MRNTLFYLNYYNYLTFLLFIIHRSLWVNETTHTGYANQTITGAKVLKKVLEYNKDGNNNN